MVVLSRLADEELEHPYLVRICAGVPDPVEIEPQFAQHGTPLYQGTQLREMVGVLCRPPRMNAEGGEHEGTPFRQREVALVRVGIHGVGQRQDAPALDARQRFLGLIVVVEMGVGVDQHDGLGA